MINKFDAMLRTDSATASRRLAAVEDILPTVMDRMALDGATDKQKAGMSLLLADLSDTCKTTLACRAVIKTLVFEEVHSRADAIPAAHAQTFSWIFDADQTSFAEWAEEKNGSSGRRSPRERC